jgi:Predicted membrane protein
MSEISARIAADPAFVALQKSRSRFAWSLAGIVLVAYFSFILIIAFVPQVFGRVVGDFETLTLGIPIGLVIIVLCFLLTGVYVRRANRVFDPALREILQRHLQSESAANAEAGAATGEGLGAH